MDTDLILFAKKTEDLLYNGKFSDALDICLSGIEFYPEYPMGYLMLSQCLFELDDLNGAMTAAKKGLTKYPDYKPLIEYLGLIEDSLIIEEISNEFDQDYASIESFEEESTLSNSTKETELGISNTHSQSNQTNFLKLVSKYESDEPKSTNLTAENPLIVPGLSYAPLRATRSNNDERLSQSVKFPEFYNPLEAKEENEESFQTNDMDYFTTETMAGILEAQGANDEAIDAYRKLAEKFPEKADIFLNKIAKLQKTK